MEVDNTQVRFSILSNAKNLKRKQFSVYKNVFVGDDVFKDIVGEERNDNGNLIAYEAQH